MIEQAKNLHRRFYAWQQRGGTPRWFIYMGAVVYAKIIPVFIIWFGALAAINELLPEPVTVMAWIGAAALFFWIANKLDVSYSLLTNNHDH